MNKKLNILIVEDSIYFADLIARELRRVGLLNQAERVDTEEDMEAMLKLQKWDLILSDNAMPVFNALGALAVRNRIQCDTPFVILSEDISQMDVETALAQGCLKYMKKEELSRLPLEILQIIFTDKESMGFYLRSMLLK